MSPSRRDDTADELPEDVSQLSGRRPARRAADVTGTTPPARRVAPEALDALYRAKERHRRRLAALPFHEKIELLVAMQRRADAIIRSRGGAGRTVWKRPSGS